MPKQFFIKFEEIFIEFDNNTPCASKIDSQELYGNSSEKPWLLLMNPYVPTVPVCWYTEDEWARLQPIVRNCADFGTSYGEWLRKAEYLCGELERHGMKIVRIPIASERFIRWCQAEKRVPDRAALLAFSRGALNEELAQQPDLGQTAEQRTPVHEDGSPADRRRT